jgi:hypothetical protein
MGGCSRAIVEHMELGYIFSNNIEDKTLVVIILRELQKYSLALGIITRETRRIAEIMGYC